MPMTLTQYLLSKVAEEAGEVAKEALKEQQQGVDSTYKGAPATLYLRNEIIDLMVVLNMLDERDDVHTAIQRALPEQPYPRVNEFGIVAGVTDVQERMLAKRNKVCYFALHAHYNNQLMLTYKEFHVIHPYAKAWAELNGLPLPSRAPDQT